MCASRPARHWIIFSTALKGVQVIRSIQTFRNGQPRWNPYTCSYMCSMCATLDKIYLFDLSKSTCSKDKEFTSISYSTFSLIWHCLQHTSLWPLKVIKSQKSRHGDYKVIYPLLFSGNHSWSLHCLQGMSVWPFKVIWAWRTRWQTKVHIHVPICVS